MIFFSHSSRICILQLTFALVCSCSCLNVAKSAGWGVLGLMFAGYVPLCPLTPYTLFFGQLQTQLSHFLENVIFANPTQSLSIYTSTLSVWFQAAECNAANTSLLLNLINNNFLTFFTENLTILNPYLPPKTENLRPHSLLKTRPHYSQSSCENATPSSGTSPIASCKRLPSPPPRGKLACSNQLSYYQRNELN